MRKETFLNLNRLGEVPPECWGERCDMSNSPRVVQDLKALCSDDESIPWESFKLTTFLLNRKDRQRGR